MLINKVKLLQSLPNVDKGAVLERNLYGYYKVVDNYGELYSIDELVVQEKTDWFAPLLCVTEDNVEIYEDNEYYTVLDYFNNNPVRFVAVKKLNGDVYFSTKEKAEEYLQSLKPKFKVGDIAFLSKYNHFAPLTQRDIDSIPYWLEEDYYVTKATNEEIISYYKQQGWVKGAKFKYKKTIYTFNHLFSNDNWKSILVCYTENKGLLGLWLKDCELIKESEYPKSWSDLRFDKGFMINSYIPITEDLICNVGIDIKSDKHKSVYSTVSQCKSTLAFAQLTQLHAEVIRIYNENNNCDWNPDWRTKEHKHFIVRKYEYLTTVSTSKYYSSLAFPSIELAEFALENWNELWNQYYELN